MQRDYILRVIEQFGVAWAAILRITGLRAEHRYVQAAELIEQTLRRTFGFDGDALDRLSAEELVALVRLGGPAGGDEVTAEKLLVLGALAGERAELCAAQGDPDGAAGYALKGLGLNLTVLLEEAPGEERATAALDPLLARVAGYAPTPAVAEGLWRYYEGRGAFASAEDWLFRLLEVEPASLPAALAFYERLAALPDDALARGDLPRDEVAAGLAEVRGRDGIENAELRIE